MHAFIHFIITKKPLHFDVARVDTEGEKTYSCTSSMNCINNNSDKHKVTYIGFNWSCVKILDIRDSTKAKDDLELFFRGMSDELFLSIKKLQNGDYISTTKIECSEVSSLTKDSFKVGRIVYNKINDDQEYNAMSASTSSQSSYETDDESDNELSNNTTTKNTFKQTRQHSNTDITFFPPTDSNKNNTINDNSNVPKENAALFECNSSKQ